RRRRRSSRSGRPPSPRRTESSVLPHYAVRADATLSPSLQLVPLSNGRRRRLLYPSEGYEAESVRRRTFLHVAANRRPPRPSQCWGQRRAVPRPSGVVSLQQRTQAEERLGRARPRPGARATEIYAPIERSSARSPSPSRSSSATPRTFSAICSGRVAPKRTVATR